MNRKNAVPPILGAVFFTAMSVMLMRLCDDDATASVMLLFFAAALLIEAIGRIRNNLRIARRYRLQK